VQAYRAEPSRERRLWLVYALRCVKDGWPEGARLEVARWTQRTMGASSVGMSFEGYLRRLRDDVAAGLSQAERAELEADAEASAAALAPAAAAAAAAAEPRDLDRTLVHVEHVLRAPDRSLEDGARIYSELCAACHLRGALGKAVGPDLTTVGGRFGLRDLLESMAAPSRTISDQYRGVNVFLDDGDVVSGLPLLDDGTTLVLVESSGARREIDASRITSRRPAAKSVMPDGLLERLTPEQIADLCAWLLDDRAALALAGAPGDPVAPAASTSPIDYSAWRTLFDGASLAGFTADPQHWSVVEGTILGRGAGVDAASPLLLAEAPADFTLEFEMKLGAPDLPAGLVFRARASESGGLAGYRAAAGSDQWGALFDDSGRGFLARVKQEVWWPLPDRAAWNHWLVSCRGSRISVRLNGVVTVDLDDPDGPREGAIGFALPAGGTVLVRNVRMR
jgi:putative heme-binding domain-containing protein